MKVATFNINNVNRRLPNLLAWLAVAKPDVVCLQELMAEDRLFPEDAILDAGYHAVRGGLTSTSAPIVPSLYVCRRRLSTHTRMPAVR
jgi:exonuclease III